MIYVQSFRTVCSGIRIILRLLPQLLERLQCWYYWWEGSVKYAIEMALGGMIYMPSCINIGSGVQKL
jgi:hypothetical protein